MNHDGTKITYRFYGIILQIYLSRKMKYVITFQILLISFSGISQTYKQENFGNTIHGLTTIVSTIQAGPVIQYYSGYGSGFFYHKYKKDPTAYNLSSTTNSIDSSLKSIWLITNKHVLFGKDNFERKNPAFPSAMEFYLRRRVKAKDAPVWDTIRIKGKDLPLITKMHTDSLTDIVAIDVTKYILPLLLKGDSLYIYSAISTANFPQSEMIVGLSHGTTTGSEVLAIGYPRKFYDTYNLFPTVKSGIIASKWNTRYNGKPFFLIDCKLFPGSSGSLVISNYATYGTIEGKPYDWFEFLGVYSGEFYRERETVEFEEMTITKKENYNTGNVWYYYLIEEIINN